MPITGEEITMGTLRQLSIVIAMLGTVIPAAAQRTLPQTGAGPGGALPGPNASTAQADEHAPAADRNVQPVPGAMPGSSTIPSTMSEKNAADDKLITIAYIFKNLTDDERAAIYNTLHGDGASKQAMTAEVATELPLSVKLSPLPEKLVSQIPNTKGYMYVAAGSKVYLVQGPTRFVVGVFRAPTPATTGAGSPAH
jgi:hypothetical protein